MNLTPLLFTYDAIKNHQSNKFLCNKKQGVEILPVNP